MLEASCTTRFTYILEGGDVLKKEYIIRIHVQINGEYHLLENLTEEVQKEIGITLNDKALRSIGYIPVDETT
jgi:hypothetical protein